MISTIGLSIQQFHQLEGQPWQGRAVTDHLISEEPLEIWLKILPKSPGLSAITHTQPLLTLMRTPGDDINLVKGWLYTSGVISSFAQIHGIHHTGQGRLKQGASNQILVTLVAGSQVALAQQQRQEYVNSACGVCGQQSIEQLLTRLEAVRANVSTQVLPLSLAMIPVIASKLSVQQPIFQQTGGSHGVALFDSELNIIDVREDVGRHNALDKVIGANATALSDNLKVNGSLPMGLVLSGRVGFEMIQKAAMANIRYVLAFGAPSSLAVQLATELDIVLVGFIKKHNFNVYCHAQLLAP